LSQEETEAVRFSRTTRIISEIDSEEMIVLLLYTKRTYNDHQEFREKYPAIFDVPALIIGSSQDVVQKNAQFEAAKRHLISLGLLEEEIRFDRETGAAERFGNSVRKDIHLTLVGRLVLSHAGLTDKL
jgi:hypothetical protein